MAGGEGMIERSYSFETEQGSLKRKKYKLLEGEFPKFRLKFLCDTVINCNTVVAPYSSYPTLGAPPTQRLLFAKGVDNQEGPPALLSLTLSSSQVAGKVEVSSAFVL